MKKSAPKKGTAARRSGPKTGVAWKAAAKKRFGAQRAGTKRAGTNITARKARPAPPNASASTLIDARIRELGDWRGAMLSHLRALVREADPEVIEEWKWRGVPVWSHDGIICTGETYQRVVKMTFAKGAALQDPARLFNSSLEGNTRRAIDFQEGASIDGKALQALVRAAVDLNKSKSRR